LHALFQLVEVGKVGEKRVREEATIGQAAMDGRFARSALISGGVRTPIPSI
jgi:hypothetical protein